MSDKYSHLSGPQATFDFHGQGILTPAQIHALASDFVSKSFSQGLTKILIITGKGLHSKAGPVIEPILRRFLLSLDQVKSVNTARRDRGGEGALEIELNR